MYSFSSACIYAVLIDRSFDSVDDIIPLQDRVSSHCCVSLLNHLPMIRYIVQIATSILLFTQSAASQEQVDISILTDRIILLSYTDGYIDHPTSGEGRMSGVAYLNTIDQIDSQSPQNYNISSASDPNYTMSQSPIVVHRKTKSVDNTNHCDSWEFIPYYGVMGCVNLADHVTRTDLYLELSDALTAGNTYDLTVSNLALSSDITVSVDYAINGTISPAIHTNNVAYSTEAPEKYGYVYHWQGDGGALDLDDYIGNDFYLIDESDESVFLTGSMSYRTDENQQETYREDVNATPAQNFNRAKIYECDFSDFDVAGRYYLSVDGIGRSRAFDISCNAYRRPFETVMKGLFVNRSGQDIDHPYASEFRPAPHHPTLTPGFAGRLQYTSTLLCDVSDEDASEADSLVWSEGIVGDLDATWGWYQDAGDWDAYLRHVEVPIKLMLTYTAFPENFPDGQFTIPESGNAIPDIIDEARWLIRFYKRLKDETEAKEYTTGGVAGHRIFGDLWGSDLGDDDIIRGSWQDTDRPWVVSGEDVPMTFAYAGLAAHIQHIYDRFGLVDPEGIDWQAESVSAFAWAEDRYDPSRICHSAEVTWYRSYAAAALHAVTLDVEYEKAMRDAFYEGGQTDPSSLTGVKGFAAYVYLQQDEFSLATYRDSIVDIVTTTGDNNLLEIGMSRGCRWGGNPYFPMIVGHGTTPYIFEGIMAYTILKDSDPTRAANYWTVMHNTLDYFLGNNPLGMTWITGMDDYGPEAALHLDSWATGDGSVKAGIVPYGPWWNSEYSNMGSWRPEWTNQWLYPTADVWPGHERWYNNRYTALGGEFTINQNTVNAAAAYGALSGSYACDDIVNSSAEVAFLPTDSIVIYPNPMSESFRIIGLLDKYDLRIIDQMGNTVLVIPAIGADFNVPVHQLGTGVFYLQIIADNGTVEMKHIVKM